MDCKNAVQMLFFLLDASFDEEARQSLEEHVKQCPCCARKLGYRQKLLFVVRERCHRREAPDSLRLRILTSLPHRHG